MPDERKLIEASTRREVARPSSPPLQYLLLSGQIGESELIGLDEVMTKVAGFPLAGDHQCV
jgi:hypothetical protein